MKGVTRRSSRNSNSKQNTASAPLQTGRSRRSSANENTSNKRRSRSASANENTSNKKRKRNTVERSERNTVERSEKNTVERTEKNTVERTEVPTGIVDGRVIDQYCWVCHKFGSESVCDSCPRVYHNECLKRVKGNSNRLISCQCYMKRVDGRVEDFDLDKNDLLPLLQCVISESLKEGDNHTGKTAKAENQKFMRLFKTWLTGNEKLCKIMDIDVLIDCLNNEKAYSSTGQFFLDVKWIYHNCCILYGFDHDITKTALKLEKNFEVELTDLEACFKCYESKREDSDAFTKVCEKNHEIVWAKMRGSPYWPAKLLSVWNGHAYVKFFGTRDRANILTKQCLKISPVPPLKKKITTPKYLEAEIELEMYIADYRRRIGQPFPYFKVNTPLEGGNVRVRKGHKGRQRSQKAEQISRNGSSANSAEEVKCVRNFADKKGNQNVATTVEGLDSIDSGVVYSQLTFSADEQSEHGSDLNDEDEYPCALPQAPFNPDLFSTATSIPSSNNLDNEIPSNTVSADLNISGNLPIITSTMSACENVVYSSQNITHENHSGSVSNPHTNHSSLPSVEELFQLIKEANQAGAPDDEEIQILDEENKVSPVQDLLRNQALLKTLTELLFMNKPRVRHHLRNFNSNLMSTFMLLYLELNTAHLNKHDLRGFEEICHQFTKTIGLLKKKIAELEGENSNFRDEIQKLGLSFNEKDKIRAEVIEGITNQKVKEKLASSERHFMQVIESLKMELMQVKEELEEKEAAINRLNLVNNQFTESLQKIEKQVFHMSSQTEDTGYPQYKDASPDNQNEGSDQLMRKSPDCGMLVTPSTTEMMVNAPMAVVASVVQSPSMLHLDNNPSSYLNLVNTPKSKRITRKMKRI